MARSSKDDPRFDDIQHNKWNYCAEVPENCSSGNINERNQPPISPTVGVMNEHNMFNGNFTNDIYMNKHQFIGDAAPNKDENINFNNIPNVPRVKPQNYGNAMLNLGNGQIVRVLYDENNQQLIFPMSGQYERINHNPAMCDVQMQNQQPSHMFTLNQEYARNLNNHSLPPTTMQNNAYNQENNTQFSNAPTSNFLKEVLGNWEPNATGTYSPFGQKYPLNHPDAPSISVVQNSNMENPAPQALRVDSPKRNENSPLADTSNKKRIVAEVKPMRPSYSDVLAKNTKNNSQTEATRRVKPQNAETKPLSNKNNSKPEKLAHNAKHNDDTKNKSEKKQNTNTISSGSESGDINTDDNEKRQKPGKKTKNKRSNMPRKWSSLDDVTNEEEDSFNHTNESQFVFIENQEKHPKKEKKMDKSKTEKNTATEDDMKDNNEEGQPQFVFQENQSENGKAKKKKDPRNYHKAAKPAQEKKKVTQVKTRRNKPRYLGMVQNYVEHWGDVSWKAIVWFYYLLSDICHMSAHLSFDLCTSVFTQTYVSSQAVWRSCKDWVYKIGDNKYLLYIDRKLGHTWFGFWRKIKWFKKETEADSGNESDKLNANIPLPATGEEAMKRLLACKGKDPYSILGVSVKCTDDEIRRYYRRQAFLVHPDKNQQPGAEEAFKILQHAFDLIGEPERRSTYERAAAESRHAEAAWGELAQLLAQLHDKMEFAANTIRCTNCGRRHKRVLTARPCYAARSCAQCKIRHSAKEGDIWAESSMMGLLVMYYACMDGAVYQITQWASCQKKNLKQLRPDSHAVQYRIVLGNKAAPAHLTKSTPGHDPNLEEFLNNLYSKSNNPDKPPTEDKKRRNKKTK